MFGHNVSFDYYFLNNELKYLGLPIIPVNRFRCTLRIMKDVFGKMFDGQKFSFKLQNCAKLFKIANQEEAFHNALFDSFVTAKLIVKIYQFVNGSIKMEELDVPSDIAKKWNGNEYEHKDVNNIEYCQDNGANNKDKEEIKENNQNERK